MLFLCCLFLVFPQSFIANSENITLCENVTEIVERFKVLWPIEDWKKYGVFTEEYILDINTHWLKFPPPTDTSFYTIAVLYIILMIFGISGNSLVIYLFIKCKSLRTSANTLIVNLAISDGLMLIKTPIFIYNAFVRGPALGDSACQIYGFLGGLTGVLSIVTLTVISFDRYFAIRYPLNRTFAEERIKISIAIAWLYGFVFALIPVLDIGFGKYTYEGYLTSCSFDYLTNNNRVKNFILAFFIAAWFVPLCLITFSYLNILKVVTNRAMTQKRGRDSFRHVKEDKDKKQEIKLALIVLSTILLWFLSWTPYATVALLGITDNRHLITPLTSMIPALFCKTASCLNSYVYALSHPKFKTELNKLLCGFCRKKTENSRKVWTTDYRKSDKKMDFSESKDSIDAIESSTSVSLSDVNPSNIHDSTGTLKRQETMVELICLRPSFSNKRSSIRKLARKWSSKDKVKNEDENEPKVDIESIRC